MKNILLLLFTFSFVGCSIGRLATSSGKPEVTITGVTNQKVLDGISAWSKSKGDIIKVVGDYGLITSGERPISLFGKSVTVKNVYTLVQTDSGISVYGYQARTETDQIYTKAEGSNKHAYMISTEKEYILDTQSHYERIQLELEELKNFILK